MPDNLLRQSQTIVSERTLTQAAFTKIAGPLFNLHCVQYYNGCVLAGNILKDCAKDDAWRRQQA